jgi:FKBP-type peptidyl-prolyl cis-trans isomerase FklB
MGQLPVDSTYFEEMFKGINEGLQVSKNKKREAYVIGLSIGQYIANNAKGLEEQLAQYDSTLVTNPSLVMTGFMNAFKQQNQQIESNEAGMVINNMIKSLSLKGSEGNIKAGEDFLTAKAQEEGVQKTASGLLYKVVKQGNGVKPKADDRVKVHYEGRLIDGTVFDSSLQRGEPAVFPVSGVIAGFKEALMLMPVGSEWEIYIPQNLAYGEQDMGTIKPYSTLIFKLQLLGIEK